MHVRKIEVGDS